MIVVNLWDIVEIAVVAGAVVVVAALCGWIYLGDLWRKRRARRTR